MSYSLVMGDRLFRGTANVLATTTGRRIKKGSSYHQYKWKYLEPLLTPWVNRHCAVYYGLLFTFVWYVHEFSSDAFLVYTAYRNTVDFICNRSVSVEADISDISVLLMSVFVCQSSILICANWHFLLVYSSRSPQLTKLSLYVLPSITELSFLYADTGMFTRACTCLMCISCSPESYEQCLLCIMSQNCSSPSPSASPSMAQWFPWTRLQLCSPELILSHLCSPCSLELVMCRVLLRQPKDF